MSGQVYSVSYRQRWWNLRRYACGYVKPEEAFTTVQNLERLGYRRLRVEVSNQESSPKEIA